MQGSNFFFVETEIGIAENFIKVSFEKQLQSGGVMNTHIDTTWDQFYKEISANIFLSLY